MRTQTPQELLEQLHPGQIIFGGCLGSDREKLLQRGAAVFDYYEDPRLQYANAVPTAEGAISILIDRLPGTLQGSTGLISGFGRIGKTLSQKLKLLGADLTVSARKDADLGAIEAFGMRPVQTGRYLCCLDQYDYIINTVPAAVLAPDHYKQIRPDCLLLELASPPGGFEEKYCREYDLQIVRAPGLPGRCAPKAAGEAIAAAVVRILKLE